MSARLHFIVEGQTEEAFVNRVLLKHLASHSVWVDARCVMTSRKGSVVHRGGLSSYTKAKKDIILWMKEDQNSDSFYTTMFDLYALPRDFPGFDKVQSISDPRDRVIKLEEAVLKDINHPRFIPYLQLHEFEALILADPQKLDWLYFEHEQAIKNLVEMVSKYDSPELINDGVDTAPSKRIIKEIPEYEGMKPTAGPLAVEKIGIKTLRERCPHFNCWLEKLEKPNLHYLPS